MSPSGSGMQSGGVEWGVMAVHTDSFLSSIPSSAADVDECETVVCPGENEQCENTEGSYRCVCAEGYRKEEGVCMKEQIPGKQGGWEAGLGRAGP